jgi:hypothetical protein
MKSRQQSAKNLPLHILMNPNPTSLKLMLQEEQWELYCLKDKKMDAYTP